MEETATRSWLSVWLLVLGSSMVLQILGMGTSGDRVGSRYVEEDVASLRMDVNS